MKGTTSLQAAVLLFTSSLLCLHEVLPALFSAVSVKSSGAISRRMPLSAFVQHESKIEDLGVTRRSAVQRLVITNTFPFFISRHYALAETKLSSSPLAELPMQKIRLPKGAVGRDFVLIQLKIQGQGPFNFMLDSGLTTDLITPHLEKILGIQGSGATVTGLAAGGGNTGKLVKLSGASLCCGSFASGNSELPLPTLYAVVSDFPQEHLDPDHDPVEGMLGMEMLQLFDADFDFPKGKLRLWPPGTAVSLNEGLVQIPAAVLNESGLIGIRIISTNQALAQPMVGIIDCGSSFTIVNWAAADMIGLPRDEKFYRDSPSILGMGVDGRPQKMPTTKVQFTFCGDVYSSGEKLQFTPPPPNWKPWDPVTVGIEDLPVFADLLGDGKTPYKGPAVLVGLDILSQRRVIIETGASRVRRLAVAPSA